jgi:hypothetical protein
MSLLCTSLSLQQLLREFHGADIARLHGWNMAIIVAAEVIQLNVRSLSEPTENQDCSLRPVFFWYTRVYKCSFPGLRSTE